jgi:formylglycine-generating enzyme required for sulfatase activity
MLFITKFVETVNQRHMARNIYKISVLFFLTIGFANLHAQGLKKLNLSHNGTGVFQDAEGNNSRSYNFANVPILSYLVNGNLKTTYQGKVTPQQDRILINEGNLQISYKSVAFENGIKAIVIFKNTSAKDTLHIENVVPFGESPDHVYITGKGDHELSRSHLFRPGFEPVNVILPDNAWESGFSAINLDGATGICALVRRTGWDKVKAQRRRFETLLFPDGSVTYTFWADLFSGNWQEGLRLMFQDRFLYDVKETFDNSLFERDDLKWIRHAYAMHLVMNWDHQFFDTKTGEFHLKNMLEQGQNLYGGDDVIGIWPNWPMLGLDQRNQWDLYRALPGGTAKLKELAELCRRYGTKLFISYNPWDESTRNEDHHAGMSDMIEKTTADGVVLDTEGKSSREHQAAADKVRPGVIMYSEGMAVPRDMQGIVAGRVHNALYYPPLLNLNKFIKPDFAIFRVAEVHREHIRREYATSFFNGYGTELNIFPPGRPDWMDEEYRFFGRTLMILRENTNNFVAPGYTPLIPTKVDKVYVNKWPLEYKTVYTIFSLVPEGVDTSLFEAEQKPGWHYFDLWRHAPVHIDTIGIETFLYVEIDGFSKRFLGTNNESAVGAIGFFPNNIHIDLIRDSLTLSATAGTRIKIWKGDPSYEKTCHEYPVTVNNIKLYDDFGRYEGKFVVQLFKEDELIDETSFEIPFATPRRISSVVRTAIPVKIPKNMVNIPAGVFFQQSTFGDNFIPNPVVDEKQKVSMHSFYMDKFPVTNAQFEVFLKATNFKPGDTANFLKHWTNGAIPAGQENFPVIWISYEDAKAYATWAGKRLPTETEWQYAAQTEKLYEWPWGDKVKVARKEEVVTSTLTVSKLQVDPAYCNTGNGKLYPVGKYKKGINSNGLYDLVGCVWQLTNDEYDNGTNYYLVVKGGSYFLPASSWWYVEGGPRELTYTQKLLRISQGFERCGTVGFRCVMDGE